LIGIYERKAGFGHARDCEIEAHIFLTVMIGRAVRHQQNFRAGFGETFGDVRAPHVLTDRRADAHAIEVQGAGHGPRREDALFVEDAVIRQIDLEAHATDASDAQETHGVVKYSLFEPGRADQERGPAIGGFARERFNRGAACGLKGGLEDKVLRRVAGYEQFGEDNNIRAAGGGLAAGAAGFLQIAGDIADRRIELGDGNRELVGRIHGDGLAPCRIRRNLANKTPLPENNAREFTLAA
jgi:hypothetical protein